MNWVTATAKQIAADPRLWEQRRAAYYRTFYGTPEAKAVFADLRRYLNRRLGPLETTSMARCALHDVEHMIFERAGGTDQMAVINGEASAAMKGQPPAPPAKQDLLKPTNNT